MNEYKNRRRFIGILNNLSLIVTCIGSLILAFYVQSTEIEEIVVLQGILAILSFICISLFLDRLGESSHVRQKVEQIESKIEKVITLAEASDNINIDELITSRTKIPPLEKRLNGATKVCVLGGTLGRMLDEALPYFEDLARSQCEFNFIVVDPKSGASKQLFDTVVIESTKYENYISKLNTSLHELMTFKNRFKNEVEVKTYSYSPPFSIVLIEYSNGCSTIQVELYTYKVRAMNRPILIFDRDRNPKMYSFFKNQFDSIFESEQSKPIENNIPESRKPDATEVKKVIGNPEERV